MDRPKCPIGMATNSIRLFLLLLEEENKDSIEGNVCVVFETKYVCKQKVRYRPYFSSYRGQELIKWVGSVGATENKMSLAATLESTLHDPIKVQGSLIA